MKRFFHLSIGGIVLDSAGITAIENALNSGGNTDWYRQGAYSWFIYSSGGLEQWRDYLKTVSVLSSGSASFALIEMKAPVVGYLLPSAWEWLKKPRY
jgi:hypothetical protein